MAFRTKIEMPKSLTDGFPASANVIYVKSTTKPCAAQWLQMAKTRHKTNSLVVSRIFNSKFQQIRKISVSGDCMPFMFKICQIVMCISTASQFHEFLKSNFWRVFDVGPQLFCVAVSQPGTLLYVSGHVGISSAKIIYTTGFF